MTPATRRFPHVVQVGFFEDPAQRPPAQLLDAWPTLVDVAEATARAGVRISVVQACAHSQRISREGVHYYFLPFGARRGAGTALTQLLHELAADLFHVHGLGFPREVLALAALVPGVPIVLQDHASRLPPLWRRASWRRGMAAAAGITFCAAEQARPFAGAGLLGPSTRVYEIPESTCRFAPGAREEARRQTALAGDPAVLWVGHLDANKDPLTVLDGVSAAARQLPELRLFCCFGTAPLLPAVQDRISGDPGLRERVHLLGKVPHDRIEQLMRAADLFVLGSHREGSGYSLIEAMACGLPPVVTDIPSFRALTGAGAVGKLWPCGDSRALAQALQTLAVRVDDGMRSAVRKHFDRELSFDALGLKLASMYAQVIQQRRQRTSAPQCTPEHA
jgi:glycosyltransferase involved in cell wall biosynthesis